jgi:hypothetical protein
VNSRLRRDCILMQEFQYADQAVGHAGLLSSAEIDVSAQRGVAYMASGR